MPAANLPLKALITANVQQALEEDIGSGDISASLIAADRQISAVIECRQDAVLCGQAWAEEAFKQIDTAIRPTWLATDGDQMTAGTLVCRLSGPARGILSAERTALNFLQTLSATATCTRQYAEKIAGTHAVLLDTRKTLPGLRAAQKYAVCCGGGNNHRFGLFDAYLIKENHIAAAGGIEAAVKTAKSQQRGVMLEVEVSNIAELNQALAAGPDRILLDNFDLATLSEAVHITAGRIPLEASGNVSLTNLRAIADTGVDYISTGALTKNINAVDLSLITE